MLLPRERRHCRAPDQRLKWILAKPGQIEQISMMNIIALFVSCFLFLCLFQFVHLVNEAGAKAKLFQPTRGRDLLQQQSQECAHFLKDHTVKCLF